MSESKNMELAVAQRRLQVSELYLRGLNQIAIARRLRVAQATVCRDISAIQDEWRASGIRNFDLLRETELRKLDLLEREAWAAWERSQQPAPVAATDDPEGSVPTDTTPIHQVGNPKFLDQVNRCIAQRRMLLGLDAPLQVANVTPLVAESLEQRQSRLKQIFQTVNRKTALRGLPEPQAEG